MKVNYNFQITTEDKEKIIDSHGNIQLNIEKFKEVERICKEWGCSPIDLITFFIGHLSPESAEQLISTMQQI